MLLERGMQLFFALGKSGQHFSTNLIFETFFKHLDEDVDDHAKSCHLLNICLQDHRQERLHGRRITGYNHKINFSQGTKFKFLSLPWFDKQTIVSSIHRVFVEF